MSQLLIESVQYFIAKNHIKGISILFLSERCNMLMKYRPEIDDLRALAVLSVITLNSH